MDRFDPAGDYLRIAERYRQMKDEELLILMPQISELTDSAQQALANEFRSRGLKLDAEPEKPPNPPRFQPPAALFERERAKFANSADGEVVDPEAANEASEEQGDSYEEDRKLVDVCTVWSVRDALKVQTILDGAGIPFFMGPEKAPSVDQLTSDFTKGVVVKIMQIGIPWARVGMQHYEPEDDPTPPEPKELEEIPVRCPVCHSIEVVFEGLSDEKATADEAPEKFKWTCDACGNQWEDDGTVKEA